MAVAARVWVWGWVAKRVAAVGCACGGGGGWGCADGHGGWAWRRMRWVAAGTVVEDGGGGASADMVVGGDSGDRCTVVAMQWWGCWWCGNVGSGGGVWWWWWLCGPSPAIGGSAGHAGVLWLPVSISLLLMVQPKTRCGGLMRAHAGSRCHGGAYRTLTTSQELRSVWVKRKVAVEQLWATLGQTLSSL
ncbi:hypothetical protein K439DRAFT_1622295 [Ramaria rubella]|nr:hypothetical protein K439DRAFT_1622295 [Ramaria rubella]